MTHARRVPVVAVGWADLVGNFSGSRTEVRDLVDYCRVFSAEDVMRVGLAAYREEVRVLSNPPPEEGPWVDAEGLTWSSPEGFVSGFLATFEKRLRELAERSPRYREVEAYREAQDVLSEAVFAAPQEHELPLCGNVAQPTNAGEAA